MGIQLTSSDHYQIIEDLSNHFPTWDLCYVSPVSRSGFYKWRQRQYQPLTKKQREDEELKTLILELHQYFHHTYGYPRLTQEINTLYHKPVNHKRVYRLQKELVFKPKFISVRKLRSMKEIVPRMS
ncbi:IS3 family transposase [Bacillus tianshenii]|nr:IS3 family transposase [Bacillus tianshenii]